VLADWQLQRGISFDADGDRKEVEGKSPTDGTVILTLEDSSLVMLIDVHSSSSSPTITQYTYLGFIDLDDLDGPLEEQTHVNFIQDVDWEDD